MSHLPKMEGTEERDTVVRVLTTARKDHGSAERLEKPTAGEPPTQSLVRSHAYFSLDNMLLYPGKETEMYLNT